MAAGRHPPTFDRIARSSWRQALSGFITINSTNTNSVYKPDRDPDLCHRQLQHDAKGVARSGGCSPSSAAGHSASLEGEEIGEKRFYKLFLRNAEDDTEVALDGIFTALEAFAADEAFPADVAIIVLGRDADGAQ